MTLTAGADDGGRRLDRILRKALPDTPLSGIHRLLRKGRVLVNGRPSAAEDRVAAGSIITIPDSAVPPLPPGKPSTPPETCLRGARFSLRILREDPDLLFINKPPGLAVHGPASLNGQVLAYLADKIPPSLSFRPGPLHRLDKPTSGIVVFSKTLAGARSFSALLREGGIKKQYLAVVEGAVRAPELWEDLLIRDRGEQKTFPAGTGGAGHKETAKPAFTHIRPLAVYEGGSKNRGCFSLILAEIKTGRTHQIRAQAAAHGFPLAGDKKYGGGPRPGGFLLHAWKLEVPARGDKKPLRLIAPPPAAFRACMGELFGKAP